ncbi:MAG: AbrB/MazE/SpoVT family DNA-binding domain-containing protein [Chloroflexota bacterium]|nr:AbrB/MazE/SpoVT family DNA-binding domain-containing protein [Chloroflexota bacterium]MDE2941134.1 AbrB/MazE/SpoVT family DNA-binding domain-containing protein [Chloroflexota bacterium]MDE3267340.1 AbrB/MazE/SpoVT family DNA-binding domain-containing protein [Chloroflexota bacterium]
MRISERGQITIPKHLRDRFGMKRDVEVEITPTDGGLLIRKRAAELHPVDRVAGVLDGGDFDIDEYVKEMRGL